MLRDTVLRHAATAALLLASGLAAAQAPSGTTPPAATPAEPASPAAPPDQPATPATPAEPGARQGTAGPQLTPAEMRRASAEAIVKMRTSVSDLVTLLEEARKSKDVVKINFINDKLTQMKGLLRIAEKADADLIEALAKGDLAQAQLEFAKVSIALSKVDQAHTEANAVVGQVAFASSENLSVDVEAPEYLPKADLTEIVVPPMAVEIRQPPASPTL